MMDQPELFTVTLYPWDVFLDALLKRLGRGWDMLLMHTDLIVGGLNFACDYLCVIHNEMNYNSYHILAEIPSLGLTWSTGTRENICNPWAP